MKKKLLLWAQTATFCGFVLVANQSLAGNKNENKKKAAVTEAAKKIQSEGDSTSSSTELSDLSLEALMDVKVVSASKKAESLFDAPLSIGSLTKEEIKRSGVTSIIEALRLIPGLFVIEHTNGNYDVQIRGLGNLPLNTSLTSATNSITLVMIDNRPVYNYFNGGTFWETLPVDLNDVEKIEVVRGPAQALYGPNAAAGVINIITRKPEKEGFYSVANAMGGIPNTLIGNASVGYKKDKFDVIVSGNYQNRVRFENKYFDWNRNTKLPTDSLRNYLTGVPVDVNGRPNINERYPEPNLAMRKFGYNAFLNYNLNDKISFSLVGGGQNSIIQGAYLENLITPMVTRLSNTNYVDFRTKIHGFSGQVAYQGGLQDASRGFNAYKYTFGTLDATAEYDFVFGNFSIKPGFNYRSATYDDSKYVDVSQNQGFINGSKTLTNVAGALKFEYDDHKMFRFVAAGRVDKYNAPSDAYLSGELAGYVKPNEKNLIRLVYSRAYRGPTIYDIYGSQSLFVGNIALGPGVQLPGYAVLKGNSKLKLQEIDLIELGYRVKALEFLHFDLDVFYQISRNYNMLVGLPTNVDFVNGRVVLGQNVQNLDLTTYQRGATLAANIGFKKVQIKPFVTMQYTALSNSPVGRDSANVLTNTVNVGNPKNTPGFFGGLYSNFQITSKLNANLSGYYFGPYTYTNLYALIGSGNVQNGNIDVAGKLLVNLKVGYKVLDKLEVFINARNLFGASSYEFAQTDRTGGLYMIGASFEY